MSHYILTAAEHIQKEYNGNTILRDVSLHMKKGEISTDLVISILINRLQSCFYLPRLDCFFFGSTNYKITDRARNVHLLQYTAKHGRRILNKQLIAVILLAFLLTTALLIQRSLPDSGRA